jgi:PIN domain nuclease of toxin-antitoxin system
MNVVLDASAVIAFLRGESGSEVVESYLDRQIYTCYMHALNLCEVYYDLLRASDAIVAERAMADILRLGVRERTDLGPEFWRRAGKLKAERRRVSLADCFAVILAQTLEAVLVSADRHELEPLSRASVCSIEFIR